MLRIPHCLDNRPTDGEIVSLDAPAALCSPETFFSLSGTHFCESLSKPQGLVLLEGLGKLKKYVITSSGIEHATFLLVAQLFNLYTTALPQQYGFYYLVRSISELISGVYLNRTT
jgi:hypothetical protein